MNFRKQVKPKKPDKKQQKEDALENLFSLIFLKVDKEFLMLLIAKYFQ